MIFDDRACFIIRPQRHTRNRTNQTTPDYAEALPWKTPPERPLAEQPCQKTPGKPETRSGHHDNITPKADRWIEAEPP